MGLTVPELQKLLEKETREKMVEMVLDLQANVKAVIQDNLKNIVGSALGFDMSWGRWEIRNQQPSPITNAFGELALAELKLTMPDFLDTLRNDEKLKQHMGDALERNYEYTLKRKIAEQLDDWINKESKRQADLVIAALKPPEKKT